MPTVLKSGSLNLLEPSGPVQACNGIALPLPLHFCPYNSHSSLSSSYGSSVRFLAMTSYNIHSIIKVSTVSGTRKSLPVHKNKLLDPLLSQINKVLATLGSILITSSHIPSSLTYSDSPTKILYAFLKDNQSENKSHDRSLLSSLYQEINSWG